MSESESSAPAEQKSGGVPRMRATMSLANFNEAGKSSREHRASLASSAEEFVRRNGGKRTINKVLIANNGIAGRMIDKLGNCIIINCTRILLQL